MNNNHQTISKFLALISVIATIGMPINSHFKLLLLSISLVGIIYGEYHAANFYKLFKYSVLLIIGLLIKFNLPKLNIIETHNVFLINKQNTSNISLYRKNLPLQVFNYFSDQFESNYLVSADCDSSQPNCWKNFVPTLQDQFNAFAADSFWSSKNPNFSRIVNEINIDNRYDVKLGTFNDIKYNFFDPPTNNIYREKMPYFIIYKIPKELLGMNLYWQGDILWPDSQSLTLENYQLIKHSAFLPKKISKFDIGKNIYLSGIQNIQSPIKVYLEKNRFYKALEFTDNLITIIGIFLILNMFSYKNKVKISAIAAIILFQLLNIAFFAKTLLEGMPILVGGGDGLVFYGYARLMLQQLISGNYLEVLRGLEDSFYYMPGMRYLYLIELIFFGDTFYGYLLFLMFIPIIIFNFLRTIFSIKSSIILLGLFFIPWLKYFGFANVAYIKFVLTGYSETLAYGLFLLASTIIIKFNYTELLKKFLIANFILAIAVFLRPNLIIGSTILIFWGIWQLRNKLPKQQIIIALSGFSPILFMLWHNIYYANEFALFTGKKSFYINLITPPMTYWHAFCEMLRGQLGAAVQQVQEQLHQWNRAVYIFRIPSIITAIYCLKCKTINQEIKLIAILGILMQIQLLFFNPKIRYAGLAWFFCFITMIYVITNIKNKVFYNESNKELQPS